jgi:hypothetical protein
LVSVNDGSKEKVLVETEQQNHADIVQDYAFPLDWDIANRVHKRGNCEYEHENQDVDPRLDLQHEVVESSRFARARGVAQYVRGVQKQSENVGYDGALVFAPRRTLRYDALDIPVYGGLNTRVFRFGDEEEEEESFENTDEQDVEEEGYGALGDFYLE